MSEGLSDAFDVVRAIPKSLSITNLQAISLFAAL